MTLHLFVDVKNEILVHAFHGDEKEAARFIKFKHEHPVTHIRVKDGQVFIGSQHE
jgi:hypothetical protein